jgi:hypothetical protein
MDMRRWALLIVLWCSTDAPWLDAGWPRAPDSRCMDRRCALCWLVVRHCSRTGCVLMDMRVDRGVLGTVCAGW